MNVPYLLSRVAGAGATVLLGCVLCVPLAQAQATIDDCEKIQAADAYNQCLAKFGPPQKSQNLEPERPGDVKGSSEEAAATAGRAHGVGRSGVGRGRRGGSRKGGGGRKRMTISVGRRHR